MSAYRARMVARKAAKGFVSLEVSGVEGYAARSLMVFLVYAKFAKGYG